MTARLSHHSESPRRFVAWLATPGGLATLFLIGFVIRIVLARGGGFPYDMTAFQAWSGRLASSGPWHFYPRGTEKFFVDYPPGYLYVLWVLGLAARLGHNGFPPVFWIKLPAIACDLGLAWVVSLAAHRLAPPAIVRRVPVRALAAAAILLNPAVFFVSATWGQADAILALLVVASFLLLATGPATFKREAAGVAVLAVAIATKPQSVFVVPMVVLLLVWRHVRGAVESTPEPSLRGSALRGGLARLASLALIAATAGYVMYIPFALSPAAALHRYLLSTRTYPVTSVFGFNIWGAIGFWRPDNGGGANVVRFLGVPVLFWGMALFVGIGALVLGRAWAALRDGHDEGRVLFLGGAALSLVSFAVVTRVHERYLFLPLALCAALIGIRWFRRAFVVLSVLYLANIYFPYVYYLGVENRPALKFGPLFDAIYGMEVDSVQLRYMSVLIAGACLLIAWKSWRALDTATPLATDAPDPVDAPSTIAIVEVPPREKRWTLQLHPVGRVGAVLALIAFVLAFALRLIGLGHPPGMYFDEVYHARAGAEYFGHKEVFEYTHPPLAKEFIGFSIQHLSNFNAHEGGLLPDRAAPSTVQPRDRGEVWARTDGTRTEVVSGRIDPSCSARPASTITAVNGFAPDAAAANETSVYLAGRAGDEAKLLRLDGDTERWRASLPAPAKAVAIAHDRLTGDDRVYVLTTTGDLVGVSSNGVPDTVAVGAGGLTSSGADGPVWASFPSEGKIASWGSDGKRAAVIETGGQPRAIAEHHDAERVFVSLGDTLVSYDTDQNSEQARIPGGADHLAVVPEAPVVWATNGTRVSAIEALSGVAIGHVAFARPPDVLTADQTHHMLVGITDGRLECAGGRPQFAWRFGSALMGAVMVAMILLIALRMFGSIPLASLAALFLAIDGLAFTMSRFATIDSYVTGFLLAAWFCVLSALYAWGGSRSSNSWLDPPKDRFRTSMWLVATGVFGGLALASKWIGLYGLAGIGLLLLWDGFTRRERSVWHAAGGFLPTSVLVFATLLLLPLAIYLLSYQPYMSLGHSFVDVLRLQRSMYEYHSTLTATHPFGSRFFFWPIGRRAVFLYLGGTGSPHSEIWTIPNMVVFWGGLVGMVFVAKRVWTSRSTPLAVILLAVAVQYLPWTVVGRVTFLYHYLAAVPFLALALAWVLVEEIRDRPWGKSVATGVTTAAVALFIFLYPLLIGWDVSTRYMDLVKNALPWVFR